MKASRLFAYLDLYARKVVFEPERNVFELDCTFSNTHGEVFEFFLFGFQLVAERGQQIDSGSRCGALVPIYKRVAADDGLHESGSFLER